MGKIVLVYLFTFMAFGLASAQTPDAITSIAFTKQTRGFLDELVISKDSIKEKVKNLRAPEKSKHYSSSIDMDEWTMLLASLKGVSLKHVDSLQSPTMNRAHDGAMHSAIVLTFEDGTSVTHGFDDENPHQDLRPLLKVIRAISSKQ